MAIKATPTTNLDKTFLLVGEDGARLVLGPRFNLTIQLDGLAAEIKIPVKEIHSANYAEDQGITLFFFGMELFISAMVFRDTERLRNFSAALDSVLN